MKNGEIFGGPGKRFANTNQQWTVHVPVKYQSKYLTGCSVLGFNGVGGRGGEEVIRFLQFH